MRLYCPKIDDNHLSGPHHIVIPITTVIRRIGKGVLSSRVTESVTGAEYVICEACDHWVKRFVFGCACYCHAETLNY